MPQVLRGSMVPKPSQDVTVIICLNFNSVEKVLGPWYEVSTHKCVEVTDNLRT
jgi:hypothetical protein